MAEPQYLLTLTHLPPDLSPTMLGQTIRLKRLPTTVGRGKDAAITVKHRSISRLHCRFYLADGRLAVKDLASTNGTLINGHRINQDSYVQVGDQITFGSIVFRVSLLETQTPDRSPEPVGKPKGAPNQQVEAPASAGQSLPKKGDTVRVPMVPSITTPAMPTSGNISDASGASLSGSSSGMSAMATAEPEEEGEVMVEPLLEDSGNLESLVQFSEEHSPAVAASLRLGNVPSGFRVDDSVVFIEADENAPEPESDSSMDHGQSPSAVAGEQEMAVEGAMDREDVASLMKRHALSDGGRAEPASQPADNQPLSFDENAPTAAVPIIPDRREDRQPATSSGDSEADVIDLDGPRRASEISSVDIETSRIERSAVDLSSFPPLKGEANVEGDQFVIDQPLDGKDASVSALDQFFRNKKSKE